MTYSIYQSTEGIIKVYEGNAGFKYYLDIDNRYDEGFDSKYKFDQFMKSVKAEFIGYDN